MTASEFIVWKVKKLAKIKKENPNFTMKEALEYLTKEADEIAKKDVNFFGDFDYKSALKS